MRKTSGSRSISSAMAWPRASRMAIVGMSLLARLTFGGVAALEDVVPRGLRLLLGPGDGVLDRLLGLVVERLELGLGEADAQETLARRDDGVVDLPGLDLFLRPVLRRVAHGVPAVAIREGLYERRASAGS